MKNCEIHIRDPYIVNENGMYYMIGTRGKSFGISTGGFDIYKSTDLENWDGPFPVFDSAKNGINSDSNWAPEIHKYKGKYYIFATFGQANGNRGTYSLVCDTIDGQYVPCSDGALTPFEWFSLDGTLYVDKNGQPWLIFCHEHVQILNGTVCAMKLNDELSAPISEPKVLIYGSDATCRQGEPEDPEGRYVTDGPFLYNGKNDRLYMIWSTGYNGYKQCIAVSDNGMPDGNWTQMEDIFSDDGGHGMIFTDFDGKLRLTLHSPNNQPDERPVMLYLEDTGSTLKASV